LHYHICFRTHRRKAIFHSHDRIDALSQALSELCSLNDVHLVEMDCQTDHVQLLLSLRPDQVISDVLKALKARSSATIVQKFGGSAPLWARGYLARSSGKVTVQAARVYLANQAEHHGYDKRMRPPVYRFRVREPDVLKTAHASFDLNHQIVLAT